MHATAYAGLFYVSYRPGVWQYLAQDEPGAVPYVTGAWYRTRAGLLMDLPDFAESMGYPLAAGA